MEQLTREVGLQWGDDGLLLFRERRLYLLVAQDALAGAEAARLRGALLGLGHPRIAVITLPGRMHHLSHDDHQPVAPPPAP